MRTTRNGPQRRRRGAPRTALFCILLVAVASAGCNKAQTAQEGIPEEADNLHAPTSPTSEKTAGALSDATEKPAPKQPKIRFDKPDYDFGEVEAGDEVEHSFVFENAGDDLLSIKEVLTSCGCTGALVIEEGVPPGGTGEIKATFHTKASRGT